MRAARRLGHGPGFAVDLGCGDGADTAELLRRGWTVLAADRQPAAIALAEHNVPDHHRPRLRTLTADFTALALPAADLIYCGWSLPHCPATRFPSTWHAIRAALQPRGRIAAAHLLGHRDDWAPDPAASAFRPDALDTLLAGMDVEHLEENRAGPRLLRRAQALALLRDHRPQTRGNRALARDCLTPCQPRAP